MTETRSIRSSRLFRSLALIALLAVASLDAEGAGRAKLSRDLVGRLGSGSDRAVRVIVSGDEGRIARLAARHGGRIAKQLDGAAVLEVAERTLEALSEDSEVAHLSGDVPVRRLMAVTTAAIGADQAWEGALAGVAGVTGRGVGVAVIDSGIASHPALRGRVVAAVDFTDSMGSAQDQYGHGTHVAGIIAASQDSGYAGVAPDAHLVSLKVLKDDGSGDTSDVIAAIDWAVKNRARYNLRVINLSLGHPVFESYRDDPLCQAVERAVSAGMVVVAAAGNFGKTAEGKAVVGGIVSPGNSPSALTVGASNTRGTALRSDDLMATYSSRGPTAVDGLLKPELVAPGNRIVAAAAPAAYLTKTYSERVVLGAAQGKYIEMSGTSMSTAVVSGSVALLLDARPQLNPAEVKLALQVTSSRLAGAGLIEAGAGEVNVVAALGLVAGENLMSVTQIAGEQISAQGISYQPATDLFGSEVAARILVWGNHLSPTVPGEVAGNILVWGNVLVWGNILVWGNSVQDGDILVWGNIANLMNSASRVDGNILVWGNSGPDGDILVWGNSGSEGDILVWGNSGPDGDILVWGNDVLGGD